jgi:hypothetical protein
MHAGQLPVSLILGMSMVSNRYIYIFIVQLIVAGTWKQACTHAGGKHHDLNFKALAAVEPKFTIMWLTY